jgi:GrpB-like predicted nucleotidyltransferase (UPF0157 family)
MDPELRRLIAEIGSDPQRDADPFELWSRLRATYGPAVNVIDLYTLVARNRGLQAHELPVAEREQLSSRALPLTRDGFEFIAGSGRAERDPIEIASYDEIWPQRFMAWQTRLAEALGDTGRRIEHVGSTAVPALPAKPVIDIQVSVEDLDAESGYVPPIEGLGVQLRSRDLEHRYFRPFTRLPRDVHVHVCFLGGEWERRHLLFRDYLRANAAAREAYAISKELAANRWSDDRVAYTEAKDGQIRELMSAAEVWAPRTGWFVPSGDL